MISNNGGVTNLSESFELLHSIFFWFYQCRKHHNPNETIFVRKERLNSASVLKNNPEVDETTKIIDTRFQPARNSIAIQKLGMET